ncbi:hypothetical protein [Candidatus Formimonas warabiya]|uniref:Uncharacterized protein n=1 Tax=Formimonas warabiya TaxID=1761012 RepID=A0A3G1KPU5_FORW1|nr:hypothetical protein [Candidatus Formimonas warabiya]ATW24165.1 hypothetical protein DCMF_04645 [Candidatus Formimonas warabiya]
MTKEKDLFPTRRLTVINKDWPETIIIQHDIGPMIRKTFGLEGKKPDKPADIIPLKRDRD